MDRERDKGEEGGVSFDLASPGQDYSVRCYVYWDRRLNDFVFLGDAEMAKAAGGLAEWLNWNERN